jgi:hypothetical protein
MQSAEQLQGLIDRDLITETGLVPLTSSYSLDTVRSTLASLCPPASDKDTLTLGHLLSIAQSSPLTVTPAMYWKFSSIYLLGLLRAGASGWTYAAMKAIFLRNSAYNSGQASQLLVTFCNLMLSGQLLSQV